MRTKQETFGKQMRAEQGTAAAGVYSRKALNGKHVRSVNARRCVYGAASRGHRTDGASEAEVWRSVGMPERVREDGWMPKGRFMLEDGRYGVVMTWGSVLGVAVEKGDRVTDAAVKVLGQITADVAGVDKVAAGFVRIFLKHSASVYLTYKQGRGTADTPVDTEFSYHGEMPRFPEMRIETDRQQVLTAPVAGIGLSSALGSTSSRPAAADAKRLTEHLKEGYRMLKAEAESLGYAIQPVLARYRVEDMRGDTLAVGPTVMVGSDSGFQCTGEVEFDVSNDGATVGGSAMSAQGYTMRLIGMEAMPAPWSVIAHRVVVETSEPIEPWDEDGVTAAGEVSSDGRRMTLKMRLPGSAGTGTGSTAGLQNRVWSAIEKNRWIERMVVQLPFDGATESVAVAMRAGTARDVGSHLPFRDNESYGKVFEASSGGVVASDPRRASFEGYGVKQLTVRSRSGSGVQMQGIVAVTLVNPDGSVEQTVRRTTLADMEPTALSAVWCYPDERATEMFVQLSDGTTVRSQRVKLRGSKGLGCSYYIGAQFGGGLPPAATAEVNPGGTTATAQKGAGGLQAGTYATLSDRRGYRLLNTGEAEGIAEWPSGSSGIDFTRTRIALGTRTGIYQLTIDGENRLNSVRRMMSGGISGDFRESIDEKGRFLLAVSGGRVVKVYGGKAVEVIPGADMALEAVYEPTYGELWWTEADGDGAVRLRRGCRHGVDWETTEVEYAGLSGELKLTEWNGQLLASGAGGLYDLGRENGAERVRFAVTMRHDMGPAVGGCASGCYDVKFYGTAVNGSIELCGDRGTRIAEPIVRLKVEGDVNAAVPIAMAGARRRYVELAVDVTANTDAEYGGLEWLARQE